MPCSIHEILLGILAFGGRPFLFAGSVRDAVYTAMTGLSAAPRDYDIGVRLMERTCFDQFVLSLGGVPNRYGGYKLSAADGSDVDLWRIEETAGIVANACSPTVRNVLRSFVLDLNAVAYDPNAKVIHDRGCLSALSRRQIGLVPAALLHDHSNFAARALVLQERFAFRLSPRLRAFVAEKHDSKETERQLAKTASHYSFMPSGFATTPLTFDF